VQHHTQATRGTAQSAREPQPGGRGLLGTLPRAGDHVPGLHRDGHRAARTVDREADELGVVAGSERRTRAWRTTTAAERRTGLLGTDGLTGALWIEPCSSVHTFGMHYPLDLAFVRRDGRVIGTTTMRPGRLGVPRLGARSVVELPTGSLDRLGIRAGTTLSLEPD